MLKTSAPRFTELDALRGIAALSVVVYHYTTKYREFFGHTFSDQYDFKYGYYGVPLFFIISGFVIFMTINKVKRPSEFLERRFVRLYPTFWVCMIITFIGVNVAGVIPIMQTTWKDAAFNLTMFYRVLRVFTNIADVDGAYWSLLPELQFYLLIFFVFLTKKLRYIKLICLGWLALILIENYLFHIRILGLLLDLQFGGFFVAGILFYKIAVDKENTIINHLMICATLVMNILLFVKWEHKGAWVAIPLVYAIFYLFSFGKLTWLKSKILLFLGTISYPLYLIHQNLGYAVIKKLEILGYPGFNVIPFVILFFILMASIISFGVEKPILKFLKNKWSLS